MAKTAKMTKVLVTLAVVLSAGFASAIPLSMARSKIGSIIANPKEMTSVMKQLSAKDQVKFVAEVNAAIDKMPASEEEQIAIYLNVNKAAMVGAAKGNIVPLLGEVFATASVKSLTVINERFANDLFNRSSDPSKTYTDESFRKIASSAMENIEVRLKEVDDSGVRGSLAALMWIRASNLANGMSTKEIFDQVQTAGKALGVDTDKEETKAAAKEQAQAEVQQQAQAEAQQNAAATQMTDADRLAQMTQSVFNNLSKETQQAAVSDWLVDALKADSNYDNMLTTVQDVSGDTTVDVSVIMVVAGPQQEAALLADLSSGKSKDKKDDSSSSSSKSGTSSTSKISGSISSVISNPDQNSVSGIGANNPEPIGYQWQSTH